MTYTNVESLVDISPVAVPAFGKTSIALHSLEAGESLASQLVRARHRALMEVSR